MRQHIIHIQIINMIFLLHTKNSPYASFHASVQLVNHSYNLLHNEIRMKSTHFMKQTAASRRGYAVSADTEFNSITAYFVATRVVFWPQTGFLTGITFTLRPVL